MFFVSLCIMCLMRLFLQRYEKRFIADIPACIDIDFSLFVNIHDYKISLTA